MLSLLGVALAVGVIVGLRAEQSGLGPRLSFLTDSQLASKVVDPALHTAKAVLLDGENVLLNCARGIAAENEVDRLMLDIKHMDLQRIAYKREQALATGILVTDANDYVPATVHLQGKQARAKVRLKGDLPDHWTTDKWSLRINLKSDDAIGGMTTFSIQHPMTRDFANEWIALAALRREGLLTVPYHFLDVTINGEHKGIYAMEGLFDHRLMENQRQTAGPVMRFNETLRWDEFLRSQSDELDAGSFSSSLIDGFADDMSRGSAFERAASMLEGFRTGKLRASEVFDVQRMTMYIAFRDLFGSEELDWNDFRLFYNTVTSRLEPIGFDMHIGRRIDRLFCYGGGTKHKEYEWIERPDSVITRFFSDPEFFAGYVQALAKISEPGYLDGLFSDIQPQLDRELSVLYREYPYVTSPKPVLLANQQMIRGLIAPSEAMRAYHDSTDGHRINLVVGNIQSLMVEMLGVSHPNFKTRVPLKGDSMFLASKSIFDHIAYQPMSLEIPDGVEWDDTTMAAGLTIHYRIVGRSDEQTITVHPWRQQVEAVVSGDFLLQPEAIDGLPWLTIDRAGRRITLQPGEWKVDRDVVIPSGFVVAAGPGMRLDLSAGAKIISYSRLDFQGDPDHPIRIESSDQTGQGVVVINAEAESTLVHCIFEHLGYPKENGWSTTGSLVFYRSPVTMEDCQIRSAHAEDALNVKLSPFHFTRLLIADSQSDAFDSDFSDGVFDQCAFERCGNDAIDVSGCRVEVRHLRVDGTHDKALNAGEHAEIIADDVEIQHAEIALGSKDLSRLTASNVRIFDSRVGLTSYLKKPEFGPGWMSISGLTMERVERPFLLEEGSTMLVDGTASGPAIADVKGILYGVEYGVNSKNTR